MSTNLCGVQHKSPMDTVRLATLAGLSSYFRIACVDGTVSAFILAMCGGAPYENDNYSSFPRKYTRFVHVDRVVVSPIFRGLRLGSLLCEELFRYARNKSIPLVTCEYNSAQ